MKKKIEKPYSESIHYEEVIVESEEDEFEIGQCYEETPAKRLECKKCGSKEWIVGKGAYFTAVKCPKCLYELCIHDG